MSSLYRRNLTTPVLQSAHHSCLHTYNTICLSENSSSHSLNDYTSFLTIRLENVAISPLLCPRALVSFLFWGVGGGLWVLCANI